MQLARAPLASPGLASRQRLAARPAARLVVRAEAKPEESVMTKVLAPAALAAAVVLSGSLFNPEPALAARSGGRAGASSFSARRAAPRAAPAPAVRNYSSTTIVTAPPVFSPFGFGGFGYGFGMPVFMPVPIFGGLLQFMFLMLVVSFVFNVVRGAVGSGSSSSNKKSQDWDDL